jgi:hypothetical protein
LSEIDKDVVLVLALDLRHRGAMDDSGRFDGLITRCHNLPHAAELPVGHSESRMDKNGNYFRERD